MMTFNKLKLFVLVMCFIFTGVSVAEYSYPVLEKLLKQQKYQLAYQHASSIRDENEGDPRFDYLYGFSALQAGSL